MLSLSCATVSTSLVLPTSQFYQPAMPVARNNLPMKATIVRTISLVALLLIAAATAQSQVGITNGIPYNSSILDTAASPYLPQLPQGPAGTHGFLKNDGNGGFAFDDGTPARFFGVTMQLTACFPDSADAIVMAARLRKLGVNLVKFEYFDFSYDWAQVYSFLDQTTGFRTINETQMRKLDWFIYQLKQRGIYTGLTLQSARAPRREDGLGELADSALYYGLGFNYLYPQAKATHKLVARLLMDRVNPWTNIAYKNDPAIAMLELMKQGGLVPYWRANYITHNPDAYSFSYHHSRRLDTLFANYLKGKYGSTNALNAAWTMVPPQGGFPNHVRESSFEGDFDQEWDINAYNETTISKILSGDSVPNGKYALTLRVRNSSGEIYTAYMRQYLQVGFDTLYMLTFKAKTSDPAGTNLVVAGSQSTDGAGVGLYRTGMISPYWKEDTVVFLCPIRTTAPVIVGFYFGAGNADVTFDDIQLRPVTVPGLIPGETIEQANIARIPWNHEANYILNSKRIQDQSAFYLGLQQGYFEDVKRYLADTLGARQPITGASYFWASNFMEVPTQQNMDYGLAEAGWDYNENLGEGKWRIRNYSYLHNFGYAGPLYNLTMTALEKQPYVASFAHPFPNRYQAESMLYLPAYSSLQDWDGITWAVFSDANYLLRGNAIDSLQYYPIVKNPVLNALLPAASQFYRSFALAPSTSPIHIQHSEANTQRMPRMENQWSVYGVPGSFNGYVMAINKVVVDSLNAEYPTQANDIGLPTVADGELISDTREINWRTATFDLSLNAPRVQGATGYLGRSENITLKNLEIDLQSGNETSTFLWVPNDPAQSLDKVGRSFLVIASRTEPTGMVWQDTTYASQWGAGPMLIDPVRATLTFTLDTAVQGLTITPLDADGMPNGTPIIATRSGKFFTATIDQRTTKAMWYSVQAGTTSAAPDEETLAGVGLAAYPSIASSRTFVEIRTPSHRSLVRVEIFNSMGERVATAFEGSVNSRESLRVDCSNLPQGSYRLQLRTEQGETATTGLVIAR